MQYILSKSICISGKVELESSKSISNRVLIIDKLAENNGSILHLSTCDDTVVTRQALCNCSKVVDVMAAGTAMRFLTAYFASQNKGLHTLTGTDRTCHRPIGILVDALRSLGAEIVYAREEGFPPLNIMGRKLDGGELSLKSNVSSQFISALLLVSPYFSEGLTLHLEGEIASKPYINMTLALMKCFGAIASWGDDHTLEVKSHHYESVGDFKVESDWSAASYWYEMVALAPNEGARIELPALYKNSLQGDSKVADYFRPLGVSTVWKDDETLWITKDPSLLTEGRIDIDLSTTPDLAQTLVVTYCLMGCPFKVTGLKTLAIKETDRLRALQVELSKLGYVLYIENGDTLSWNGEKVAEHRSEGIDTYNDHRMAMAFAPASLIFDDLIINNPNVVSKSYPGFWDDMERMSVDINKIK